MCKNVFIRALPLALITLCLMPALAFATTGHGPKYELEIVEGETTLPEYVTVAHTHGVVEPSTEVAVSIIHNGVTVYRGVEPHGHSVWMSGEIPQIGDTVTLESPIGTIVASDIYDGLPLADPTVCAGSTNFSGQNSSGETVIGTHVKWLLDHDPYGRIDGHHFTGFGEAQVKTLSGTTFGGSFLTPLALGDTLETIESLKTPLANEATYTYISETDRPVTACPVPPPPYVPPAPPVLQGRVAKLLKSTIHAFLRFGARDQVTINQPGTVTQDLYLTGGKLPAFAAGSSKHHKKLPPALLLARGSTTTKTAGTVTVLLKSTAKGRHKLKSSRSVRAILITTLRSGSGAKIDLQRRSISLHS